MLKCEVLVRMFSHRSRRAGSGRLGARSGDRTDLPLEAGMTRNAKLMTAAAAVIALMLHNTTTRGVAQP